MPSAPGDVWHLPPPSLPALGELGPGPSDALLSSRACSGRGLLGLLAVLVTRGRRLRCGSAERGTSGERACRGRPRRGGSAQRQEGGAAGRGRLAAGGGEGRAGPAARATCGAGWLPLSAGGEHSFPAGVRERASWRAHRLASTHARARDHPCCSPGRADGAAAVSLRPESRGKAEPLCLRERQVSAGPLGYQAQQTAPPSSGKPVSLLVTGSGLVPADPRERVGSCGCARPGKTWSCDFRGCM